MRVEGEVFVVAPIQTAISRLLTLERSHPAGTTMNVEGAMMDYFDYETVAREARLTQEQLSQVIERVRRDFPTDPMLRELHVLRACRAIRDGEVTLAQFLAEPAAA